MTISLLFDVAPDPVSTGILAVTVLLVIGLIVVVAGGLVFFLWYRKRSMRNPETGRSEDSHIRASAIQPSSPNQP